MRELFVVAEESTDSLWVLRTQEGERFCIPREELIPPTVPTQKVTEGFDSGFDADSENYEVVEAELVDEPATTPEPEFSRPTFTVYSADSLAEYAEAGSVEPAERTDKTERAKPIPAIAPAQPAEPAEPDPLFATPLSLRPKEIQARIRAGATTEELAEEMGVAMSRVEPYAHPVLLERAQVAEAARQSHPVREDGPASDTLFEVLALTFASRGHTLAEATWDAVREVGEPWVVRVTWQAGLQEHQAEWYFRRSMANGVTTEPRDAVAADLIDPSFAQPVRSLSSVGHPGFSAPTDFTEPTVDPRNYREYPHQDNLSTRNNPQPHNEYNVYNEYDEHNTQAPEVDNANSRTQPNLFSEGEFLQQPDPKDKPQKRRRKAVTPHWEDVLLGVRTNTKRPK
nr:Protein of uncharacterised function (DUF3071) [Streptococcus thermophilus]